MWKTPDILEGSPGYLSMEVCPGSLLPFAATGGRSKAIVQEEMTPVTVTCLLCRFTGCHLGGAPRHSQSTLWSCAVPCLWDCAFVPTCFYAVGVLWNESLPLCPQWTITPSNGLESCCACKVSQKHSQKLWPSPNLDRDSGLWIWSIKSLSSSMWKNVPWITVGLTYCACSSYPSADKNFPMFVCPHLNLPPELPAIPALLGRAFGGGRDSSAGSSSHVGLGFSKTRQCSVFITIVWMDLLSSSLSPCCPSVKLRNH